MTMRLPLQDNTNATLISVYAPTMTNPDEIKEVFYQQLDVVVPSVPTADRLIILGNLNARIGSNHTAWTGIIGHHGIGQENSNGRLPLFFCSQHSLSVKNTFFKLKDAYKTTLMHPRSKHWNQLDFIICKQRDMHDFTRAMRGAECLTDHLPPRSKMSFQIRRKRRPQGKKPPKKLDVSQTKNPDLVLALQSELSKRLEQVIFYKGETGENWAKLRDKVDSAARETIDVLKKHHQDWFDDNDSEIQGLLHAVCCTQGLAC